MGERPSNYERSTDDWYVEPSWAVEALSNLVMFHGPVHDPCCGMGTIPRSLEGTGSDLVDRGYGYPSVNFLEDATARVNIVTNPPYNIAEDIIRHALLVTSHRVAALVQTKFLSSQKRHSLFKDRRTEKILIFSKRPSMPPGKMLEEHGEGIRGGGSIDFCWVIWNQSYQWPRPTVDWVV